MTTNTLFIVADRGSLKAFHVDELPTRSPRLRPVRSLDLTEARGRFDDKLTDRAGNFAGSFSGNGQQAGGAAEHGTIELENDRRACKHLAEAIAEIVREEKPEGWSLAAPAQIFNLVVDSLPKEVSRHLTEKVHADLVNMTDPAKIAGHFPSLQPTPKA